MSQVAITKRLTAEEFDQLSEKAIGRTEDIRKAARAVLVDGRGLQEVADEFGFTRQRLLAIRNRVYSKYLESELSPPGWVKATVTAPKPMLEQFAVEVERARRAYFSAKPAGSKPK